MSTDPHPAHRQSGYRVRMEWGLPGARAVLPGVDHAVVVDVLSFTTAVTVAVGRGVAGLPCRWRGASAASYAEARGAVLARGRREALADGGPSLSPRSLMDLVGVERVVLPSPHGATLTLELADAGAGVVAASLRNASAVAAWLAERLGSRGAVALVAAGERWPDGSLRPALEDLWGAGAVAAGLRDLGVGGFSPEAEQAAGAFDGVRHRLPGRLADCASGAELVAAGFAEDVEIAAGLDRSFTVPVLVEGAFVAG